MKGDPVSNAVDEIVRLVEDNMPLSVEGRVREETRRVLERLCARASQHGAVEQRIRIVRWLMFRDPRIGESLLLLEHMEPGPWDSIGIRAPQLEADE